MKAGPSFITFSILVISAFTQAGCVTRELWSDTTFFPVEPANLRLFESSQPRDVLVHYDEEHRGNNCSQPRAFFLFLNVTNLASQRRPSFVSVSSSHGLTPIPVFETASPATNATPRSGYFAMTTSDQSQFTLYLDQTNIGNFVLPIYDGVTCKAWRVFLTPLAVGLDIGSSLHP